MHSPFLAAFMPVLPLTRRTTPTATRSGGRRPPPEDLTNGGADGSDQRARPFTNPQHRQNTPQRRSTPASGNAFRFFDSDQPDQRRNSRGRGRQSRTGRRFQSRSDIETDDDSIQALEDDDEEEDDAALSEVDDTVDDGFFSRYRKESAPGQRITDYADLDASDRDEEEKNGEQTVDKKSLRGNPSPRRMDRQTAANAFDAVDRLFGSIKSSKNGDQQSDFRDSRKRSPTNAEAGRNPIRTDRQLDRASWLRDVRARASTKGDSEGNRGDDSAVDVDAVEDLSGERQTDNGGDDGNTIDSGQRDGLAERAMQDDFDEAEIGRNSGTDEKTTRTSGFRDQGTGDESDRSRARDGQDKFRGRDSGNSRSRSYASPEKPSFHNEDMFQNLMNIARMGPPSAQGASRRKQSGRPQRQNRQSSLSNNNENRTQGRNPDTKREGKVEERSEQSPDISRLLGLTKQIRVVSNREKEAKANGDYEEVDDEMEKSITISGSASEEVLESDRRRQRFSSVRRNGGIALENETFSEEVRPLTVEEVANVTSDSGSISGGSGDLRNRGIVADCQSCRGTGLEACAICVGKGWIEPLSETEIDSERRAALEEIWKRPNLVVDVQGEAQCVACNGIGKQFCGDCEGSGSALKKGFSLADKNEVFDIFPDVDSSSSEEFEFDEEIDEEEAEDDEDEEDEEEEFQLYTGPGTVFEAKPDGSPVKESDSVVADDGIEVEDESVELLAALEAMHIADVEDGRLEYAEDIVNERNVISEDDEEDEDDDEEDDDEDFELVLSEEEGDEGIVSEDLEAGILGERSLVDGDEDEDDGAGEEEEIVTDLGLEPVDSENAAGIKLDNGEGGFDAPDSIDDVD